jgi:hypothetical protein
VGRNVEISEVVLCRQVENWKNKVSSVHGRWQNIPLVCTVSTVSTGKGTVFKSSAMQCCGSGSHHFAGHGS